MRIDAYCVVGVDREFDLTGDRLLHAMDEAEVDKAVIAPPDRFIAVDNREGNDSMLAEAGAHPDRLIPSCSVNPWYGARAIDEARRAISAGARLLVLHPLIQGFSLSDELVYPAIECADSEHVPVYVHTGAYGTATPWQLARLAQRFPNTDFIMGHCGATDFWNDVVTAGAAPNVYLESSLARPFKFARHMDQAGVDKGIFGSFAPINDLSFEWRQAMDYRPESEYGAIYGANLTALLTRRGDI